MTFIGISYSKSSAANKFKTDLYNAVIRRFKLVLPMMNSNTAARMNGGFVCLCNPRVCAKCLNESIIWSKDNCLPAIWFFFFVIYQANQTFAGFISVRMRCFSLSFLTVNEESLKFGLLLGQKKVFEDVILSFGN